MKIEKREGMDVSGATISDETTPSGTRDIYFPNQKDDVGEIAIDIGGTLAKVTYFSRKKGSSGGRLQFHSFQTECINDFYCFLQQILQGGENGKVTIKKVKATGGGSHKYFDMLKEKTQVEVEKEDEMTCLICGLNFLLQQVSCEVFTYNENQPFQYEHVKTKDQMYPYLLVNIGSGVSILKVTGENSFQRVSGTSLGGGTLWGLLSLLTDSKDFDEMLKLSLTGDHHNVDMLVGDIYGRDYETIGLTSNTIASSFGKVFKKDIGKNCVRREDIAKSALLMVSNNIGQIAYLNALHHNIDRIYFGGSFIRGHLDTMKTISYAIDFWSKGSIKALFLRHDGYLGCLGALIKDWYQAPHTLPSFEENFARPSPFLKSFGNLGSLDSREETLVRFPLVSGPYEPDTISLKESSLRNYWLAFFEKSIPTTSKAIKACNEGNLEIDSKLLCFEKCFKEIITKLRQNPGSYGQLSVRSLLNLREQCLHEYVSNDPYAKIKNAENEMALQQLPQRLKKIDSLPEKTRLKETVDGILTGNMFDWGAKDSMELMINGEINFDNAYEKITRPGLKDTYELFEKKILSGQNYKKAFVFLDNSGADTILGVLPFARELLMRGTSIVLAANSSPTLNDITFSELTGILDKVSEIDPVLHRAIQEKKLISVSTGNASPCINLLRVNETCAKLAETADFLVLIGVGRGVLTNYYANFTCDSLRLAVIKNESIAHFLGGSNFDAVCHFEQKNV